MSEKLPRFVELVRVSTQAQAERDTPENQRRYLDKMRTSRPGVFVKRIEVTDGVSGAKDFAQRPDLQQLATLAATKAFDELRVFAIDRLTRHPDLRERSMVFGLLADAGAKVVDVTGQQIDPREEVGELHWSMLTWAAAQERKRFAARAKSGKERRAAAGRLAQGPRPWGRTFNKETGTWGTDPDAMRTYRRMFDLCLAGRSLSQIASQLDKEGRPSPRGGTWSGGNVSRLLREPAAMGRYTTHGHTFDIPKVVSEEVFRAVDAKLRENNSAGGPRPSVFVLLRKIAVCAICESPMYVQLGGGTPSLIRYYYCSARCHRQYLRAADVDAAAIERLKRWLDDPRTLAAAATRDKPDIPKQARDAIAEAEHELKDLDRQEEWLTRQGRHGKLTQKNFDKQLGEIVALRERAQRELKEAQARLADAAREAEVQAGLGDAIASMRKNLRDGTPQRWRKLIERNFPRGSIKLHPDGGIELDGRVPVGKPVLRSHPNRAGDLESW